MSDPTKFRSRRVMIRESNYLLADAYAKASGAEIADQYVDQILTNFFAGHPASNAIEALQKRHREELAEALKQPTDADVRKMIDAATA